MSKLTIRKGTVEDCISLAPRLRAEDVLELVLTMEGSLEEILTGSLAESYECYVGEAGGVVIAMGGIVLTDSPVGIPWLVGSPEVVQYPVALVRYGRSSVDRWLQVRPVLENFTWARNTVHHEWLRHIGFTLDPLQVPCGPHQEPFIHFSRKLNV